MTWIDRLRELNRKERFWVLRESIGRQRLDADFCEKLKNSIGCFVPQGAFWALDYQWNWLEEVFSKPRNSEKIEGEPSDPKATIEDVDFLIAFENTLVLIEAKVDESWSNDQLSRKLVRLKTLKTLIDSDMPNGESGWQSSVKIYFLLMSPKEPEKLDQGSRKCIASFNGWSEEPERNWLKLESTTKKSKVTQDG